VENGTSDGRICAGRVGRCRDERAGRALDYRDPDGPTGVGALGRDGFNAGLRGTEEVGLAVVDVDPMVGLGTTVGAVTPADADGNNRHSPSLSTSRVGPPGRRHEARG
jgi:hypothetical protein